MAKCKACGVNIIDAAGTCPLCHHALQREDSRKIKSAAEFQEDEQEAFSQTYPNILGTVKKLDFLFRLFTLLCVFAGVLCVFINVVVTPKSKWSVIVVVSLLYVLFMLQLFTADTGYLKRMFYGIFGAVCVVVLIDSSTGFGGWSLDFAIPAAMLAIDLALILLMLINRRNWQSYIQFQLLMAVISTASLIFVRLGIIHFPWLLYVAFLVSVLAFAATLIMGGSASREELSRRFHI